MASNQIKLSRSSLDNQKSQCIKILLQTTKIKQSKDPNRQNSFPHVEHELSLFIKNDELYDSLPQFAQCTCANNRPTPSKLSYVPIIFDRYTKSHSRLEPVDGIRLDNSLTRLMLFISDLSLFIESM